MKKFFKNAKWRIRFSYRRVLLQYLRSSKEGRELKLSYSKREITSKLKIYISSSLQVELCPQKDILTL